MDRTLLTPTPQRVTVMTIYQREALDTAYSLGKRDPSTGQVLASEVRNALVPWQELLDDLRDARVVFPSQADARKSLDRLRELCRMLVGDNVPKSLEGT